MDLGSEKFNLRLKARILKSCKPQAPSLTACPGDDRMNLERNNYGYNTIKKNSRRSGGDPETSKERHGKDGGICQKKKLIPLVLIKQSTGTS